MRQLALVLTLVCVFVGAGCRVFTAPSPPAPTPTPPPVHARVVPTAAYAGQTVRLELSGRTLDLSKVTVHLGQAVADARIIADGALQVTVPRLEGACQGELVLEASSPEAPIPAVTLTYLGAGHPGAPRLSEAHDQHLAFVPRQFVASSLGDLSATAFGPLQVNLDAQGLVRSTEALTDFPALLVHAAAPTCGGRDAVVRASESGSLKFFAENDVTKLACSAGQCIPPDPCTGLGVGTDYEAALPSAISNDDSSMAGQVSSLGETIGLLLTGDGGVAAFAGDVDAGVVTTALPASSVAQFVVGARAKVQRAYSDATPWVVVRDGLSPELLASDAQGQEVTSVSLLAQGQARLLASGSGGDFQQLATTTTGYIATAWQVTPQNAPEPCDPNDAACAAELPVGYSLQLAQLNHYDDGGGQFYVVSTPLSEPVALTDLAVLYDPPNSLVHVFAIARNEPYLRHYTWRIDSEPPLLVETVPMGAMGQRLAFTPKPLPFSALPNRIAVADDQGAVHLFDFDPSQPLLTQTQIEPIPVGLATLASEVGQSCSEPAVLAGAQQLGSVVIAPTREGASPAFFAAPSGAQAVLGVTVASADGNHSLLYLASGGPNGFSVAPSLAEAQALGISSQAQPYTFGATSMAQVSAADGPYLVVGGPSGLGAVHLRYGMPTSGVAVAPDATYGGCGAVRQVAAMGSQVLALGTTGSQAMLCSLDPVTGVVKQGVPFDPGYTRFGLASAAQRDPQSPGASWVVLAGQVGSKLMLAWVDPAQLQSAPQPIPISDAVANLVLPQDSSPLSALGLSPDGHRLLLGFGGTVPGLVALDPLQLLDPSASDADRISQSGTTVLSGTPTAIALTPDGALALLAQDDDHLVSFR